MWCINGRLVFGRPSGFARSVDTSNQRSVARQHPANIAPLALCGPYLNHMLRGCRGSLFRVADLCDKIVVVCLADSGSYNASGRRPSTLPRYVTPSISGACPGVRPTDRSESDRAPRALPPLGSGTALISREIWRCVNIGSNRSCLTSSGS